MWNPFKRKPKRLGDLMADYLKAGEQIFGVGYNEREHQRYEELRATVQCAEDESLADGIRRLALRVKDLERSERELAEQRDHAEEWADNLAGAIAAHFREDIGEHSNLNRPWANAHNLIFGNFCR